MNLQLITSILVQEVAKLYQVTVYQPAYVAIRDKGSEHWEDWMLAKFGFQPNRKQQILDYING